MFGRPQPPTPTHERVRVPSRAAAGDSLEEIRGRSSLRAEDAPRGALELYGPRPKASKSDSGSEPDDRTAATAAQSRDYAAATGAAAQQPTHAFASQATSRQRSLPNRVQQLPQHQHQHSSARTPAFSMSSGRHGGAGGLPVSSSNTSGGGLTPSLRQYHSPIRKWVWAAFGANVMLAVIFAALCASSYKTFRAAVEQLDRGETAGFPAGSKASDWQRLFAGAAISAAFAIVLTVIFHAWALALLLCSFKSLADPNRRFGRAFVMSAALCIGLHILNIALQFHGYGPTLSTWHAQYGAPFNLTLLTATVVFGLLSFLNYTLLGGLMFFWQDPPDVYLLETRSLTPAGVQL
ncbi:hypothetical protein PLESTB_000874600 [Pleodorina starrii]|uniref:Uncharacterized protein n=1 Tax=Pleodorina starrii TaxID=330485 RepID=A0A9W6BLS1_9CHLO|nr:hypothetical protein PLESTM_001752800 [Pleodorina starrii]GLC54512.1 hypothetical protein PLESTB_000874600 [Pleodorina starrii]